MSPTIIEIRPYRNGWKVFEAAGVELPARFDLLPELRAAAGNQAGGARVLQFVYRRRRRTTPKRLVLVRRQAKPQKNNRKSEAFEALRRVQEQQ